MAHVQLKATDRNGVALATVILDKQLLGIPTVTNELIFAEFAKLQAEYPDGYVFINRPKQGNY